MKTSSLYKVTFSCCAVFFVFVRYLIWIRDKVCNNLILQMTFNVSLE